MWMLQCLLLFSALVLGRSSHDAWSLFGTQEKDLCIAPIEAPEARSAAEFSRRHAVDNILHRFWDRRSGFKINAEEEEQINSIALSGEGSKSRQRPSTYGEVTPIGVRQVARALGIDAASAEDCLDNATSTSRVEFLDLGSGVGKTVAQAYLEWPCVARSTGIELSTSRARMAQEAWKAAAMSEQAEALLTPRDSRGVVLLEGDLLKADVSKATHIYLSSLCFGDDMLQRIAAKLAKEAAHLRGLAMLRRFPRGLEGFEEKEQIYAKMSWAGSHVHIYKRLEHEEQPRKAHSRIQLFEEERTNSRKTT